MSAGMSGGGPRSAMLAIGPGWALPAMVVFAFVALVYLPAHPAQSTTRAVLAAGGAMYVIGLSVIMPRLLRGVVLRHAGSREAIVVLGREHGALRSAQLAPRWRLVAVALGAGTSAMGALAAASIAGLVERGGYPHAIATLAVATNLAVAFGALAPLPGLGGWAAVLAIADARGTSPDDRVRWAAGAARAVAPAIPLLIAGLGVVVGDPMLIPLGLFIGLFVWMQAGTTRKLDVAERFFARHTATDLARPLTGMRRADDRVRDLAPTAPVTPPQSSSMRRAPSSVRWDHARSWQRWSTRAATLVMAT